MSKSKSKIGYLRIMNKYGVIIAEIPYEELDRQTPKIWKH